MAWEVIHGDCRKVLKTIASKSMDAVITDPPYPHIKRDYGYWTTEEWWALIVESIIPEVRRILKPTGSAVFILQPNFEHVGQMRGWLWEFMAWVCREWNMVQDVWWWNITTLPSISTHQGGLLRPSQKACVWCGLPDCYRKMRNVLWQESNGNRARRLSGRLDNKLRYRPSGSHVRSKRIHEACLKNDGVTPFNVLPIANTASSRIPGLRGHSARTPLKLADWWTRYIVPPGGTVLDPFCGSGTMGVAALQNDCSFIGIEKEAEYCEIAKRQLSEPREVRLSL